MATRIDKMSQRTLSCPDICHCQSGRLAMSTTAMMRNTKPTIPSATNASHSTKSPTKKPEGGAGFEAIAALTLAGTAVTVAHPQPHFGSCTGGTIRRARKFKAIATCRARWRLGAEGRGDSGLPNVCSRSQRIS
jgi:hypothetical protein